MKENFLNLKKCPFWEILKKHANKKMKGTDKRKAINSFRRVRD